VRNSVVQRRNDEYRDWPGRRMGLGHVLLWKIVWSSDPSGISGPVGGWAGCAMDVVTEEQFDAEISAADKWRDDSKAIVDLLDYHWHN
jgi:hypothetical protein